MSLKCYYAWVEYRTPGQEDEVVHIGPLWGVDVDDVWSNLEARGELVISVERAIP